MGMARRIRGRLPWLVVAGALLASGGCTCTEEVEVLNQTDSTVHVQLALPYPGYAVASSWCQFEFMLSAGERWSSKRADQAERASLRFRPLRINGVVLLRARPVSTHSWSLFALAPNGLLDELDPVTMSIGLDADSVLEVWATAANGEHIRVKRLEDDFWFVQVPGYNPDL